MKDGARSSVVTCKGAVSGDDIAGKHNMKNWVKNTKLFKRLSKNRHVARWSMALHSPVHGGLHDDRPVIGDAVPPVLMEWPSGVSKPRVGVIPDPGPSPRWTKCIRFLEANGFQHDMYDVHSSRWIEDARTFQVIVNLPSSSAYHLEELRRKFYVLEKTLGISCFPSFEGMMLYEDKILEAYLCKIHGLPFIPTFITNTAEDARHFLRNAELPLVSKIVPGSGSVSVELLRTRRECEQVIGQTFSMRGRASHSPYFRQKNYVYFQKFVRNDGYDLRVIVIDDMVFGYYRKVPEDDFRASGMGLVEKRPLPVEAMHIARRTYAVMQSPMLVVDMLRDLDGGYWIIEISPNCQIDTPEQLHVEGAPGAYIWASDDSFRFEPGRFWMQELAMRAFFRKYAEMRRGACQCAP